MKSFVSNLRWIVNKTKFYFPAIFLIISIGAVTSFISVYRAWVTKWIIDAATDISVNKLYRLLALLGVVIIGDVLLRGINSMIISKTYSRVTNKVQQEMYMSILKVKWLQFLKYHSGDYVNRITNDVNAITNMVVNTIPNITALIFLLVGSFIAIIKIDIFLGLIIIMILPLVMVIARFYSSKVKRIYLQSQKVESAYRSYISESIQNMLVVKAFCLEKINSKKISAYQNQRFDLTVSSTRLSIISNSFMAIGSSLGFFLIFIWGSFRLSNGTTTFGTLIALVQLIGNIQGPLSGLASSLPQVIYAFGSVERLRELENLKVDSDKKIKKEFSSLGILFDNVDFSYTEDSPILKNVSINIKPGDTAAIVGPSGEGKTTLIHMMLALISTDKGKIYFYDNKDKIEICPDTRKYISYVPQGNTLFSGTIAENLRLGLERASDEELKLALKAACAWDFIKELPEGINTIIGERGHGLSEGQSQRIAIARALLHKTPILLLDEATSALDAETEIKVLETIKNLNPAVTCIIITHREAALKICNKVYKFKGCSVAEQDSLINEIAISRRR